MLRSPRHLVLAALLMAAPAWLAAQEGNQDWPTYNCDVGGSRHNAGEKALSKENVGRLEEKWRFPPAAANFKIGVIHATPVVVKGYVYFGTVNKATFYKLTPDEIGRAHV